MNSDRNIKAYRNINIYNNLLKISKPDIYFFKKNHRKNPMKSNEDSKKLFKLFESHAKYFESLSITKFISNLISNYLELIRSDLTNSLPQMKESFIAKFLSKTTELNSLLDSLKKSGFFNNYGNYIKNKSNIQKIGNILNEMMILAKPLLNITIYSKIDLSDDILSKLDSTIESVSKKIEDLKRIKQGTEFKNNVKKIEDELVYIFWFSGLEKESEIDDKTFLKYLEKLLAILGKNIKKMDREKLIEEVDREKGNAITPDDVAMFFKYGLTHPTAANYDLLNNAIDEGSDEEKTLKRRKKPEPKNNKNEEENEKSLCDSDSDENNTLSVKKKPTRNFVLDDPKETGNVVLDDPTQIKNKSKNKFNISNHLENKKEEDETVQNKVKKKFIIDEQPLEESCVEFIEPLELSILETNEKSTYLRGKKKIIINTDTYQIDKEPPVKLMARYITKFGRESGEEQLQSDIKFADKTLRTVSRKQFQILGNDLNARVYKIICTSPPPKNDTCFKITDQPFRLRFDNVITLSEDESIQIESLYDNVETMVEVFPETEDNETHVNTIKRKKAKILYEEKEKKNEKNKQEAQGLPFLVLDGITETSELYGNKIRIDSEKYPNGFMFGRDFVFKKNPKANNEALIYYIKNEGWFIKTHNFNDSKWKIHTTLVSIGMYSKLIDSKNSDSVVLKKGMVIHIDGFSFRVDR